MNYSCKKYNKIILVIIRSFKCLETVIKLEQDPEYERTDRRADKIKIRVVEVTLLGINYAAKFEFLLGYYE